MDGWNDRDGFEEWMDGRRARGREGEHVRGRIVGVK